MPFVPPLCTNRAAPSYCFSLLFFDLSTDFGGLAEREGFELRPSLAYAYHLLTSPIYK